MIPPHLHDLQEADLPETQRGLVISEIAQFRERAAKREREKLREAASGPSGAPSGPKMREWGKPQPTTSAPPKQQGFGKGAQGYSKPVGFVKAGEDRSLDDLRAAPGKTTKTDEELEFERREARKREEEISFRDVSPLLLSVILANTGAQRERRYEPRERTRILALERAIQRERATKDAEERDRIEMRARLDIWDDDESDELFYVDRYVITVNSIPQVLTVTRTRWRQGRARRLEAEEAADDKSRRFEEQEAENLRRESEDFLARQMDEMQALAEEQRKAGLLLDDGAPVKLNVSLAPATTKEPGNKEKATVFVQEEEDDEEVKKRKVPLVKLDFSVAESSEQTRARLEKIKESVPHDRETLFKAKVRWDGLSDVRFFPLFKIASHC